MTSFLQFHRLFLSIWLVYLFHFRHLAAGSDRFTLLVMAIVEQKTVQLDLYFNDPFYKSFLGDVLFYNDHIYSNINPGCSLLAVPAWSVAYFFYQFIPETSALRHEAIHYFLAHFVSFAFTTALFSTLIAYLLALIVMKKMRRKWRSFLVALLYAFGSIAFYFSTRLNQNIPIALILLLLFIYLFEPNLLKPQQEKKRLITIGVLLGLGIMIDTTIFPVLLVVGLFLIGRYRQELRQLIWIVFGAIPPILVNFLYHYFAFGNPLLSPSLVFFQQQSGHETHLNSFNFVNLLEFLFTVQSGLFVYLPYGLLAIYYFCRFYQEKRLLKPIEKVFLLAIAISYLVFLGLLPSDFLFSLFGPRYLLPIIPFLCLLIALYWRKQDFHLGLILISMGVLFNLAGAQLGNDTKNIIVTATIYIVRGPFLPIIDWLYVELPRSMSVEFDFLSPYGFLLILFWCLFMIWLPKENYFRAIRLSKDRS